MTDERSAEPDEKGLPHRPVREALKRGLRNRCPACGSGRILYKYTKVHDACPSCGEELHHHRADDFPQYITIVIVAHVLVAALLLVDDLWPALPMSFHFAVWPALVVVLSLLLLPLAKSSLIAYQWALRMHGFETAHESADESAGTGGRRIGRTAA